MSRRNMGGLDRALRFAVSAALIVIGLLPLGAWHGEGIGLVVAGLALIPLVTSTTGFCPLYVPLGVSTLGGAKRRQHRGAEGKEVPVR